MPRIALILKDGSKSVFLLGSIHDTLGPAPPFSCFLSTFSCYRIKCLQFILYITRDKDLFTMVEIHFIDC